MNDSNVVHVLIHFRLLNEEATAYKELCRQECRKPAQQARYILLEELEKRGLLEDRRKK